MLLTLEVTTFAFTLWLGLYLVGRNRANGQLLLTGAGAIAYALALALEATRQLAPPSLAQSLDLWRWPLLGLPALLWLGTLISFARVEAPTRTRRPLGVIVVATLFFALGLGLIVFPLDWLPREWVLLAIGLDFAALGLAIAGLDAFAEGETLLPDMARSLVAAGCAVVLFGGPVALVIGLSTGATLAMLLLLLVHITAATATQVFADPLQALLDRAAFFRSPRLAAARAELRAVASALPRADDALDPDRLDEAEFARLTRRALGHMSDLSRLAASPLTRLPTVTARLAARGAQAGSLERAQELRALLAESIVRLKPRDRGDFGTSDEWRHYNALYFPYLLGLKPYARRFEPAGLDEAGRAALEWLRASVPERTLHNWQNAAARLVARDLREHG